jgi:hypothetical protein
MWQGGSDTMVNLEEKNSSYLASLVIGEMAEGGHRP